MPTSLHGKTIWISAAARGIGRAILLSAVAKGAHVVFGDIDKDGIEETLSLANSLCPERVIGIDCDFSNPHAWEKIEAATPTHYPPLQGLIHNVGFNPSTPFEETSLERHDNAYTVNQRSTWHGTQVALPRLKAQGGTILFINSIMFACNTFRAASYTASKGALTGLARALSVELAPHHIRVNSLLPGYIAIEPPAFYRSKIPPHLWTAFTEIFQETWLPIFRDSQPLPRPGTPADIAAATSFLLSDAASFITGVELPIDGGTSRVGLYFNSKLYGQPQWTEAMQHWLDTQLSPIHTP